MKLSIILFRHGEICSEENIFCGWLNHPLSFKGERDADVLAKKLRKEKIATAFCSDQVRSKQVLASVLAFHPSAKVVIDPRLRERHYGLLSGAPKEILKKKSKKIFNEIHRGYFANIPKGENMYHVSKRVFPFMNDLFFFMQSEKKNVAISAHSSSLRIIQEYLEGLNPKDVEKLEHAPTNYKKYVVEFEG